MDKKHGFRGTERCCKKSNPCQQLRPISTNTPAHRRHSPIAVTEIDPEVQLDWMHSAAGTACAGSAPRMPDGAAADAMTNTGKNRPVLPIFYDGLKQQTLLSTHIGESYQDQQITFVPFSVGGTNRWSARCPKSILAK